ncbi:helix-turn-helix transcriptional regulator [Garicola koreensis]|uniref:helix-turn-helix transcriptional regulator n=1 Tax=Garicola koreensis TaxID=1262554 RepID=UPI0031ECF3AE
MRTSRLLAIMMELAQGPAVTVDKLAERHGVSTRTIERDIAAMQTMGVPVWTRPGPGGGVGMVPGWTSPISGMTSAEIQALLMGEAGAAGLGLLAEFRAAQAKVSVTTESASAAAESVGEKFLIDTAQWFSAPESAAQLPRLSQALWAGRRMTISYRPYAREPLTRRLDPLGLVLKTNRWYLVAAHRGQPRTYRASRVERVTVHDDVARRPAGFSLPGYWASMRTEFDTALRTMSVLVSVPIDGAEDLQRAVPGPATEAAIAEGTGRAGRLHLSLPVESVEIAASQLVTVTGVEVHHPGQLRAMLRARGEDLALRHAD